jgi:hypothetical protein
VRIAITGDRNAKEIYRRQISEALQRLPEGSFAILGDCPTGVDAIALELCEDMGIDHVVERADWKRYGPGAGPVRNSCMLDRRPEQVWWFHTSLQASKGTKDCVGQARSRGLPIVGWGSE